MSRARNSYVGTVASIAALMAATVWTERPMRIEARGPEIAFPAESDEGLVVPLSSPLVTATFISSGIVASSAICSVTATPAIASAAYVLTTP